MRLKPSRVQNKETRQSGHRDKIEKNRLGLSK